MGEIKTDFEKELEQLINRYSMENASNTPDWILAGYLRWCLLAFDTAVQQREQWYGREPLKRKDTSKEANQCKTLNQIMFDAGYNTAIDDLERLSIKPKVTVKIDEVKTWTT